MENGRDEEGDVQDDSKCCRAVIKEQWKKVAEEFSMEKEAAFIKIWFGKLIDFDESSLKMNNSQDDLALFMS
ncbi:hypothetical protein Csa_007486 [Cucumis sativus]|nr:hypothetical protein Csa_007486 [Cucumis sativus]